MKFMFLFCFFNIQHVSSQGNPFYCQSVVSTLQLCMANPKIASSLTRYPVQTEGAVEYVSFICVCILGVSMQVQNIKICFESH